MTHYFSSFIDFNGNSFLCNNYVSQWFMVHLAITKNHFDLSFHSKFTFEINREPLEQSDFVYRTKPLLNLILIEAEANSKQFLIFPM